MANQNNPGQQDRQQQQGGAGKDRQQQQGEAGKGRQQGEQRDSNKDRNR